MLNSKNIAVMAGVGFVLSFLISILFAHTPFGWALLRGLIFALVFGVLAVAIEFMYEKFLSDGEPGDIIADSPRAAGAQSGSKVDITIGETDLTEDGLGLSFAVNNNKHVLSERDTRSVAENSARIDSISPAAGSAAQPVQAPAAAPAAAPHPEPATFRPVTLGKPLAETAVPAPALAAPAPAGEPPKAAAPAAPAAEPPKTAAPTAKTELDELPDLGIFDDGGGGSSSMGSDVIEDSEFAENGGGAVPSRISPLADPNKATDHDTATLAKAIQTVLKRDE